MGWRAVLSLATPWDSLNGTITGEAGSAAPRPTRAPLAPQPPHRLLLPLCGPLPPRATLPLPQSRH